MTTINEGSIEALYWERNRLVAALTKHYPSGITEPNSEGLRQVFVDLPTGQVSWYIHSSDVEQFAHLQPYAKAWDGHTRQEKYDRLAQLQPAKA